MNNPKPIKARIRTSDVENFKASVKIGDKFLYECLISEVVRERKAVPKFERVRVVKKYPYLVQVENIKGKTTGPIKTMTYLEMFLQKKR